MHHKVSIKLFLLVSAQAQELLKYGEILNITQVIIKIN